MRLQTLIVPVFLAALLVPSFVAHGLTATEERELLEEELRELEKEIAGYEGDIAVTRAEKETLQNTIRLLESRIAKLNLQIYQSNVLIEDLKYQIGDTTQSIVRTEQDVAGAKSQLGELLQLLYQEDRKTPLELLLSGEELTEFFNNVVALELLNNRNRELLEHLEELQVYLADQKAQLEDEKTQEENLARITILQKAESGRAQEEQQELLALTQGREVQYQRLLADKQREAQEIRSRLFELIGVPEAPTFGEALVIAQAVGEQTGVRPALLLAVLTQESNIGKNVGQCYLVNAETAEGVYISTGASVQRVMKPMGLAGRKGDVEDFLRITRELGRDPFRTPVSCPIPSVGGYGGAMGPAQFIPTTWALFEDDLAAIVGRAPDPWNIKDAFMASGLLLASNGAGRQTYSAEWCAAISYFSGSCRTAYRFYGDSVMAIAARYEKDIATLAGN